MVLCQGRSSERVVAANEHELRDIASGLTQQLNEIKNPFTFKVLYEPSGCDKSPEKSLVKTVYEFCIKFSVLVQDNSELEHTLLSYMLYSQL
ncbi:hypothetical protein [Scytonema sp. NUACC26]|uniref:hypothetical protein n=1 Tax=Scytonema sp. NUACC26 TaxID=3140176 RepID=UPI0034DC8647